MIGKPPSRASWLFLVAALLPLAGRAQLFSRGAVPPVDPYAATYATADSSSVAIQPGSAGAPLRRLPEQAAPAPTDYFHVPSAATGLPLGPFVPATATPNSSSAASKLFQPAETLARVGDDCIFRGDLEGEAELILATIVHGMSPDEQEKVRTQFAEQRERLVKQLLKQSVDRKLMYLEFQRTVPSDKKKEMKANLNKRLGEAFDEALNEMLEQVRKASESEYEELTKKDNQLFRLALFMHQRDLATVYEMDRQLVRLGTSRQYQQQAYGERQLGLQQLRTSINFQPEITHEEMLDYYYGNQQEFLVPTRARWEQLTARFDRFADKSACGQAIADMGNEVWLGGAPFWAVAKRRSQGPEAEQGGYHDWTSWGDLTVSRQLRDALFSLPLNELSGIIEDAEGLHIVRVLQREETHYVPFGDAQDKIKEKLQAEKRNQEIAKYIERLRTRTPVWTAFDDQAAPTVRTARQP